MRVFVTGAAGFVGSFVVAELISAGHDVVGLSRSDTGAEALASGGAEVFRGDVNDLERLHDAAEAADGIIHAAFNHDPSSLKQHSENDRKVIATLGAALAGTGRPLIITSGTGLVQSKAGQPVTETDDHATSAVFARAASEEAADALIDQGGNVMVMRLPQVHDSAGRAASDGISRSQGSRAASPTSVRAATGCRPSTSDAPGCSGWRWQKATGLPGTRRAGAVAQEDRARFPGQPAVRGNGRRSRPSIGRCVQAQHNLPARAREDALTTRNQLADCAVRLSSAADEAST